MYAPPAGQGRFLWCHHRFRPSRRSLSSPLTALSATSLKLLTSSSFSLLRMVPPMLSFLFFYFILMFIKNKTLILIQGQALPAVPPCLMLNAFPLQSAVTLFALYAGVTSQLLKSSMPKLSFTLPSEAHLLKLRLSGSHRPGFSEKPSLSFTPSSSV